MEPTIEASSTHSTRRRVRIAVVGAGLIGRRHVELVRTSTRATLAAIVDPAPESRALAADGGQAAWYPSLDDLLAADRPDGIVIATPNAMHLPQALACVNAMIPMLIEKPIATAVEDGLRIADAAERHGVPLLVGHHRRHSPRLTAAQRMIDEGVLGDLVAVTAATLYAKPPEYFEVAPWRREAGGGPILINLIHDVDALRMLAGDVVSVQAAASGRVRSYPVEETVAVVMRFAGGALGTMILSDTTAAPISWEMTSGEDPAYPRHGNRDAYVVAGTRGTLGIPTMRVTRATGVPSWHRRMRTTIERVMDSDPLARQLEHFVDVVKRRVPPHVTGHDAVESLRVTLAIAQAVRTQAPVDCPPPDRGQSIEP